MANGQDQKLTNSIQILNELRTGPKSRLSISKALNLQPSTVTYSINRLMELNFVTDSKELDEPKEWVDCNIYTLCKLFMNDNELIDLQKRYETPGEGYGHFKLT